MIRDHGGGIDAAAAAHGGRREDWIDLSTGINPVPYPLPAFTASDWTALPDRAATEALEHAARHFWDVPAGAAVLAAPGASGLIARMPGLAPPAEVVIGMPTYNEHAAAFDAHGWAVHDAAGGRAVAAQVLVHPNNPDGRLWSLPADRAALTVIDESFCDVTPEATLMPAAGQDGVVVLKSFGKFWGLAGMRLGFAIGAPELIARLSALIGPWPVAGPALRVGAAALSDGAWATATRARLAADADRLDQLMARRGIAAVGGTSLFRLYDTPDAVAWQGMLAGHRIWSRRFPYSDRWLRLGLPAPDQWPSLEAALARAP